MRQSFRIQKSKKGVSLIYVIIASAALIILSGVVAVSAMRNMDLTMNSSYSRSAYISDKSAIEFAKGILEQQYEAGSLKSFAVTSGDPYGWAFNDRNNYNVGTNCFATCDITPDASDSNKYTATITAGYPSSQTDKKKLLKMVYTTYCTLGGGGFPYIQCGLKYGNTEILKNAQAPTILEDKDGQGISVYPLVINLPVCVAKGTSNGILQAPQIFFMGGHIDECTSYNINGKGENALYNAAIYAYSSEKATIKSDFIYVASDRINVQEGGGDYRLNISPLNKSTGYIYFANSSGCNIYDSAGTALNHTSYKGLYSFGAGTNLFSSSCALTKVDKDAQNILDENNVGYVENERKANGHPFATAEGNSAFQPNDDYKADWTDDNGSIKASVGMGTNSSVFFYATDAGNWGLNTLTYTAKEISFMYVNSEPKITIGGNNGTTHTITFNADAVSFCGQKHDGGGTNTDSLTLRPYDVNAEFILRSNSGNGSVTVTVYHKLVIKRNNGSSYTVPAGTYTVPSGTNIFTASISNFTLKSGSGSGSDSGGSGSGGGFSGGEYSWPKN